MKIYQLTGASPYFANSFLVLSEANSAVVIDPASHLGQYQSALSETGATLKAVFCTHGHMDHVTAGWELREKYGARLYCAAEDVHTPPNALYPLPGADETFTDGQTIPLDELTFTVYRTPGHSAGSVCILCGDYFFTGDTLFRGDTGRTDLQGGDRRAMVESICRLRAMHLPAETVVLPGHEDLTSYGEEMANNWFVVNCCPPEKV